MNWPFDVLDLPAPAEAGIDAREVKRAYARRLKQIRPDEDPEGFQRLHAAYREALARCAWPADGTGADRRAQMQAVSEAASQADAAQADARTDPPSDARSDAQPDAQAEPGDTRDGARADVFAPDPRDDDHAEDGSHRMATTPEAAADGARLPVGELEPLRPTPLPSPFAAAAAAGAPRERRALAEQVVSMAVAARPDDLTAWLQGRPALWSLTDKAAIAEAVVDRLQFDRPPLTAAQFDALAAFFGWFDLRSGHAPESLFALRDRLALAHALAGGDLRGVAERLHQDGSSQAAGLREVRRLLQQLRRPWSWPQALAMALVPGLPTRLQRFLQVLRGMDGDALPAGLDPRQVAFWEAAGDREGWSWPRASVLALRLVLYPLALPLLSWLLQPGTVPAEVAGRRYLALFTALGLGWAWLRLSLGFAEWQAAQDPRERRWLGLLRRAAVPALLGLGLVLHFLPGTEPLSWLLLPTLVVGILARLAGDAYSLNALVLLLRRGWVWAMVPIAIAWLGAYSGSGFVRGLIYLFMLVFVFGMWRGARARH